MQVPNELRSTGLGSIGLQAMDLFPLSSALHTGGGPLDLEIRGRRSFSLAGGCVRVPSASIVGRRIADVFGPQAFGFGN